MNKEPFMPPYMRGSTKNLHCVKENYSEESQSEVNQYTPTGSSYDYALSKDEKQVCFHCAKILELFKLRSHAITFPSSKNSSQLNLLKLKKATYWTQDDVNFLIDIYAKSTHRQQKIFETLDTMERRINKKIEDEKV